MIFGLPGANGMLPDGSSWKKRAYGASSRAGVFGGRASYALAENTTTPKRSFVAPSCVRPAYMRSRVPCSTLDDRSRTITPLDPGGRSGVGVRLRVRDAKKAAA